MILQTLDLISLKALTAFSLARTGDGNGCDPGPVILTDTQDQYPRGLHLVILENPGGEPIIEVVASPTFDSRFDVSHEEVPDFGYTDSSCILELMRDKRQLHLLAYLCQGNLHPHLDESVSFPADTILFDTDLSQGSIIAIEGAGANQQCLTSWWRDRLRTFETRK